MYIYNTIIIIIGMDKLITLSFASYDCSYPVFVV